MKKLHKESALVIIGSFIGAAFATGWDKLTLNPMLSQVSKYTLAGCA